MKVEIKDRDICSIYEAAYLTGLSPELLTWLISYAPKYGISRKLKYHNKKDEIYFFQRAEVISFNNWLKEPWPKSKSATRPSIPTGILKEVKVEANGECAICHSHHNTCEAAHIDPVHKSLNNHPDNLLWLCSNHHTAFDKGLFYGPKQEDLDFVIHYKVSLQRYKRLLWGIQHEVSTNLLTVLESCSQLHEQLKTNSSEDQIKAVERIASETLLRIPELAPVSKSDSKYNAYIEIQRNLKELSTNSQITVKDRLAKTKVIKDEYIAAYGFEICPLCDGKGIHGDLECPVCLGDKEIEKERIAYIDLSLFEKVDCPVCEGRGVRYRDDCRACGGNAQIDRRFLDYIDPNDFNLVTCPLCVGTGKHKRDDCPVCDSDGVIEKQYADKVQLNDFEDEPCPACKGNGSYRGDECHECGGEGTIEARFLDQINQNYYHQITCPLCKGKGRCKGRDCPICQGDGEINQGILDQINLRDFELVSCPACKGNGSYRGDECHECGGEGEIERRYLEQ